MVCVSAVFVVRTDPIKQYSCWTVCECSFWVWEVPRRPSVFLPRVRAAKLCCPRPGDVGVALAERLPAAQLGEPLSLGGAVARFPGALGRASETPTRRGGDELWLLPNIFTQKCPG